MFFNVFFFFMYKCVSFIYGLKILSTVFHINFMYFLQLFQKKILIEIGLEMLCRVNYNSMVILKSSWIELNQMGTYLVPMMNICRDSVSFIYSSTTTYTVTKCIDFAF